MGDKEIRDIQGKVTDYKRFGFILLSLSIFMFLGLVIPNEVTVASDVSMYMIIGTVVSLILAFVFHRKAMHYRNLLDNEGLEQ